MVSRGTNLIPSPSLWAQNQNLKKIKEQKIFNSFNLQAHDSSPKIEATKDPKIKPEIGANLTRCL